MSGRGQGRGRTLYDAWHICCVWIIKQKVTSFPVKRRAERQNQICPRHYCQRVRPSGRPEGLREDIYVRAKKISETLQSVE